VTIEFREIDVGSPLYEAEVRLRVLVLRAPTGREHTLADRANDRRGRHFVALSDGDVIGCVGFYPQTDGAMLLRHLAVGPSLHRRGIGRALLVVAERALHRDGARRIGAEARLDAMRFYEACGFEAEGPAYEKHGVKHQRMFKALSLAEATA
jgi:predicted N-acetyltransferase YhbS